MSVATKMSALPSFSAFEIQVHAIPSGVLGGCYATAASPRLDGLAAERLRHPSVAGDHLMNQPPDNVKRNWGKRRQAAPSKCSFRKWYTSMTFWNFI